MCGAGVEVRGGAGDLALLAGAGDLPPREVILRHVSVMELSSDPSSRLSSCLSLSLLWCEASVSTAWDTRTVRLSSSTNVILSVSGPGGADLLGLGDLVRSLVTPDLTHTLARLSNRP